MNKREIKRRLRRLEDTIEELAPDLQKKIDDRAKNYDECKRCGGIFLKSFLFELPIITHNSYLYNHYGRLPLGSVKSTMKYCKACKPSYDRAEFTNEEMGIGEWKYFNIKAEENIQVNKNGTPIKKGNKK